MINVHRYLIIFFLFTNTLSNSQVPSIQWQKCFLDGNSQLPGGMHQTLDDGYIIAGFTQEQGWLLRLDTIGNIQWEKFVGGVGPLRGGFNEVCQTYDNGFIIAGTSNDTGILGNHGGGDFWVYKSDSSGSLEWQQCYGGTDFDAAYTIDLCNDGGYLIAGSTESNNGDVTNNPFPGNPINWVIKIDSIGNLQWQKTIPNTSSGSGIHFCNIKHTSDSGCVIVGFGADSIQQTINYVISKLDITGGIEWQKLYGGTWDDKANCIQQMANGGYVISGVTFSKDGDVNYNHDTISPPNNPCTSDIWIIELNSNGDLINQKSLGGIDDEFVSSIQITLDSGLLVFGYTFSKEGDVIGFHGISGTDFWLVKLDSTLNVQWQKCLGSSSYDYGYLFDQTSDGGCVLAGNTNFNDYDVNCYTGQYALWFAKLGYSDPDASIWRILYPSSHTLCDNNFFPIVQLRNFGQLPLISCTINYQVDNGILQTYNWSGYLREDSTENINLPSIFSTSGSHTLRVYVSAPNGGIDQNPINDSLTQPFIVDQNFILLPLQEGFEGSNFPPSNWTFLDPSSIYFHITSGGGFGNSSSCLSARFFSQNGFGEILSPEVSFQSALSPASLSFSLASAMKNSSSQQLLSVYASSDCAGSWNQIYLKTDTALATAQNHAGNFTPSSTDWRTENINLDSYIGLPHVQFRFQFFGYNTNNMYFDDVNILDANSLSNEISSHQGSLVCWYQRENKNLKILINSAGSGRHCQIEVADILGKIFIKKSILIVKAADELNLNVESLKSGVYFIRCNIEEESVITRKIIVGL